MAGNDQSGRPGWRERIEDYSRVDVKALKRDGVFDTMRRGIQISPACPEAALEYRAGILSLLYLIPEGHRNAGEVAKQRVTVESTPCRFGGFRPWFRCPSCGRRVSSLFKDDETRFACRRCHDLAYRSQCESWSGRRYLKANKLRWSLGGEAGAMSPIVRPKGMHENTFFMLTLKIRELEAAAITSMAASSSRP
jgi:hypothetical protein